VRTPYYKEAMPMAMYSAQPRPKGKDELHPYPMDVSINRATYIDGDYQVIMPQSLGDIWCLSNTAWSCRNLEGDIAEAGVYYGATARLLLRFFEGTNKTIHLFDTFDIMPPAGKHDIPEYWHPQSGLSVGRVATLLSDYYGKGLVRFYKGLFRNTLPEVGDKKFCFIHIDCDLYEGARDACEFFYPRVVSGGVMLFHDYDTTAFPGIRKAVDDFFLNKPDLRVSNRYGSHHVVVKR
jgi:O-methyltransferase